PVVDAGSGPEHVAPAGAAGSSVGGRLPSVARALHARSRQAALHRSADGRYQRTGRVRKQATRCHVTNVALRTTSQFANESPTKLINRIDNGAKRNSCARHARRLAFTA